MSPEPDPTATAAVPAPDAPAAETATPAAEKAAKKSSPAAITATVVASLLLVGLLVITVRYGYPANLYLLGALIPLIILNDERWGGKAWVRAVRAFLKPFAGGLALLAVFVALLEFLKPSGTTLIINWEERLVVRLFQWLDNYPTWWQYALLFGAAALVSWRLPQWKPVQRLEKVQQWLGAVAAVVAALASFTFLSEQTVVKPMYGEIHQELVMRYIDAKQRKIDSESHALAARAVVQAFSSADDETRSELHLYIEQLAELRLGDDYDASLGRSVVNRTAADPEESDAGQGADSWIARLKPIHTRPENQVPLVKEQVAEADAAEKDNADAQEGLKQMLESIAGGVSDSVLSAAMKATAGSFFGAYVDRLSEAMGPSLDPVFETLQDKAKDDLQDRLKEQENRVIERAMQKIDWKSIPHGSAQQVAAAIKTDAIAIAQARRAEAMSILDEVGRDAPNTSEMDDVSKLENLAKNAGDEAKAADHVLAVCAGTGGTAAEASTATPNPDWTERLQEANRAVEQARGKAEQAQEENDRAAERKGGRD